MFKRFWWIFLVMAGVGPLVGLIVAAIVTYMSPKIYESEGFIEVTQPTKPPSSVELMKSKRFSEIEAGMIASRENLEALTDQLHLPERWKTDRAGAVRILGKSTHCQTVTVQGRDLISIRVRSRLKEEAREIAVGLIEYFQWARTRPSDSGQRKTIDDLVEALDKQQLKTDKSQEAWLKTKKRSIFKRETDLVSIHAEQQYDADQKSLQDLMQKFEAAKALIDSSNVSVNIQLIPTTQHLPVLPDVGRNLFLGKLSGLLLSPLFSIALIIFLNRLMTSKESLAPVEPG
jgi:uncharacterized protein involved in exopolysaccharide biosynthesis